MKIKYLAHAAFLITADSGTTILLDPYQAGAFDGAIGYKSIDDQVDAITISHSHADHSYIAPCHKNAIIFDKPGKFKMKDIEINGTEIFHDEHGGKDRGKVTAFVFKVDDITLCHLGDLGHLLTPKQIAAIGNIDVLLMPVGGIYTITAESGQKVMESLSPKICVPMHYKTEKLGFDLSPMDTFIKNKPNVKMITGLGVSIEKNKLPSATEIWVMKMANY